MLMWQVIYWGGRGEKEEIVSSLGADAFACIEDQLAFVLIPCGRDPTPLTQPTPLRRGTSGPPRSLPPLPRSKLTASAPIHHLLPGICSPAPTCPPVESSGAIALADIEPLADEKNAQENRSAARIVKRVGAEDPV